MAYLKNYMTEIVIMLGLFGFMLFITTNNNTSLGTTYLQFLFGSVILLLVTLLVFDKHVDVTIKKNNTSWFEEAMWGAGGWVLLLVASFLVLKFVDPLKASLGAIMSSLNAANPIFSNSIILNYAVIALAIPIMETVLWGRGAEFIGQFFKIRITNQTKNTIGFIVLVGVLAALFALFHATSKSLSGSGLLIVFLMQVISLYLIAIRDGDMRGAIFLHIFANGVAAYLALSGGQIFSNVSHVMIPLLNHIPLLIRPILMLGGVG